MSRVKVVVQADGTQIEVPYTQAEETARDAAEARAIAAQAAAAQAAADAAAARAAAFADIPANVVSVPALRDRVNEILAILRGDVDGGTI